MIDAPDAAASEQLISSFEEAGSGPGIQLSVHAAEAGCRSGARRSRASGNVRLLQTAGLALLLSGCVTSHVRQAEVAPPPSYEAQLNSGQGLEPAALEKWWTLYGDPQLDGLVEDALKNAPDAKSALAVLAQAAATRRETLDRISIPSGQLQGSATRTDTEILDGAAGTGGVFITQDGATENYSANFNVSWELDLFGRRGAARRGVDAEFLSAAFTFEASRTALIANVANTLFQIRGLALQLQDAQQTARINRDLVRIAETRQHAGLGTSADADQAIAQAQAADAQEESFRAQLLAAQRSLLVLVGRGFDKVETLPTSPEIGQPPSIPATLPGDLLRRRPDVRSAEWKIVSAAAQLKIDDLALLPTINLQPGVSLSKSTGRFGLTSWAWSIAGNLAVPILDRPRLMAAIHGQRAVAEQTVIAYEKAVQAAYGDVETAITYLNSDERRVRMLQEAEARARSAYEKSRLGYSRGLNDLTTALQAENNWRNVQSQLSSAQTTLMQRSVQAFKALGGGWSPERPAGDTEYGAEARLGAAEARKVQ